MFLGTSSHYYSIYKVYLCSLILILYMCLSCGLAAWRQAAKSPLQTPCAANIKVSYSVDVFFRTHSRCGAFICLLIIIIIKHL